MESALAIAGLVVLGVGLALIVVGAVIVARTPTETDLGISDTIGALTKFAAQLAKQPVGMRLIFVGVLLVIIGGFMAGATALLS